MHETLQVGHICFQELATSNVEEAKKFYGQVFGWEFTDCPMGDMTYTMVRVNGKDFGGIWAIPSEQQQHISPHWMAYVLVESLEDALNKALDCGASVVKPATNVGQCGRLAVIADPNGAHIAMWQMSSRC